MGRRLPVAAGAADRLAAALAELAGMDEAALDRRWRRLHGAAAPAGLSPALQARIIAYRLQARAHGDLDRATIQALDGLARRSGARAGEAGAPLPVPDRRGHTPGTVLTREWAGTLHTVTVLPAGYAWNGARYASLSKVAQAITGTKWNGPRFFGLRASSRPSDPPESSRPGSADAGSREPARRQ